MRRVFPFFAVALLAAVTSSAATVRLAITAAVVDPITTVCPATPASVSSFPVTTSSVYFYFILDNVQAGDVVTVTWLDPASHEYTPASVYWNMSAAGNFCFETKMDVAGHAPAAQTGNWRVQIRDNQTLLVSVPFTITAVSGLSTSISQVNTSSCPGITLTVSVVDGTGTPVAGLAAGNFTLKEDGQTRAITVTQVGGGTGLSVALLLDTSLSTGTIRSEIATGAKNLVSLLSLSTAVAVYSFSTSTTLLQDYTTNHALLNAAIDSINLITGGGSTAIFNAVATATEGLAGRTGSRALVLLSDGEDNNSSITLQGAIQLAQQNAVTIFTIGYYATDRNDTVLSQLATGTGGLYQPATNNTTDLQRIFASLGQLLSPAVHYLITYSTADSTANHQISLTASQGGATSPAVTQTVDACATPCGLSPPSPPAPGVDTTPPFGYFDTPLNNTTGVVGAIPVTGWALDNVGVTQVEIYRDPRPHETPGKYGLAYVGVANFVRGSRPDVQTAYSSYPNADRAGWGYMLLTNFLPNSDGSPGIGNGTYRLHAIARDAAGNSAELGAPGKVILVDNAHAAKPFGTIDTPEQGGNASGAQYLNFGWALTPGASYTIPIDGSTIMVVVDGQAQGHPIYNQFRNDIATLFPGYTNSQGGVGFFYLDATRLSGCVHTISWVVSDNASRTEGIGSRYFTGGTVTGSNPAEQGPVAPVGRGAKLRRGFDLNVDAEPWQPGPDGVYLVEMEESDRVEMEAGVITGYLLVGGAPAELPAGSSFKGGTFYWQPGPGFLGDYRLILMRPSGDQVPVRVRVRPKTFSRGLAAPASSPVPHH